MLQGSPSDADLALSLSAHHQTYILSQSLAENFQPGRRALCKVRYIVMGKHVVVWATTASMGVRSITLAPDVAAGSVPQGSQQAAVLSMAASRIVHDELLLPVVQALCLEEDLSPPASLRTLPLEIKMLILQSLQVRQAFVSATHALCCVRCKACQSFLACAV